MSEQNAVFDRRLLLFGMGAFFGTRVTVLAAPPAASADNQAPEIKNAVVRRPWADFEAVRAVVKDANTSEMAEAYMLAELGPLPWYFAGDPEGYDVTIKALVNFEGDPRDVTGVFALAQADHPTNPAQYPHRIMLLLCGRVSMRQRIQMREIETFETFVSRKIHAAFKLDMWHFGRGWPGMISNVIIGHSSMV